MTFESLWLLLSSSCFCSLKPVAQSFSFQIIFLIQFLTIVHVLHTHKTCKLVLGQQFLKTNKSNLEWTKKLFSIHWLKKKRKWTLLHKINQSTKTSKLKRICCRHYTEKHGRNSWPFNMVSIRSNLDGTADKKNMVFIKIII